MSDWIETLKNRKAMLEDELAMVNGLLQKLGGLDPPVCGYCNTAHWGEGHDWSKNALAEAKAKEEAEAVARETAEREKIEAYVGQTAGSPFGVVQRPGM